MSDRQTTLLTPKAQHPERTQQFVSVVAESLESFEDSIGSLDENIKASAYETFITSYKDALSAHLASCRCRGHEAYFEHHNRQATSLTDRDGQTTGTATVHSQSIRRKTKDSRFGNFDINAERLMPQTTSSKFRHLQTDFRSIFQTGRSS